MSEKRVAVGDKNTTSARFVDPRDGHLPIAGSAIHRPPMSLEQQAIMRELLLKHQQEMEATQYEYDRYGEMLDADRADGVIGNFTGTGTWNGPAPNTSPLLQEFQRLSKGRPREI